MATFGFNPATEQERFSIETIKSSRSILTTSALSGEEVRNFYENLMKDDGRQDKNKHRKPESRRRSRRRVRVHSDVPVQRGTGDGGGHQTGETGHTERSRELMGLRFLHCAHEGNISGLKDLLSKGVDINFQDAFFWTAMMCASWSGQTDAVKLLLQNGAAWVGVVDTQGRDAKDLALEAGQRAVLEELDNFGRDQQTTTNTQSDSSVPQPQWCDVCQTEYSSSSLSEHLSTTLHQFSLRRPPPTPYYCLPPSSNSYKMMVRSGWKPGTGLGPEGGGRHQPVSTVLKRDQKGLGFGGGAKAKVTHFGARDRDAVKPPSNEKDERGGKAKRRQEERKEQKDKNWERDFRCSFYL
eukprot:XP_003972383.2 PREDICTED: G patch domain and ankyrin repeat-containing protein 1 [Takifugu rubripes]